MFIAQATRLGAEIGEESVISLSVFSDQKVVQTRGGVNEARAVIVAIGIQKEQLRIPGEVELKRRGVSYCAICDGPCARKAGLSAIRYVMSLNK